MAAGAAFFGGVTKRGWLDCVHRALEDRESEDRELETTFQPNITVMQDDHVLCDEGLGAAMGREDLWVAKDARTRGLGDHAPLVLEFDVLPIGMTNQGSPTEPARVLR